MAKRPVGDRGTGSERRADDPEDRAVYIISVAAELAGVHPQTLRIYERKGLLRPARTAGNTRRYSPRDIERLQTIQRLTQDLGVNLAGVKMIVEMEGEIERMRRRVERMTREMDSARLRMQQEMERVRQRHPSGEIVPLRSVERIRRQIEVKTRAQRSAPRGPIAVGPAAAVDAAFEGTS